MGRPKGSKNKNTILREAAEAKKKAIKAAPQAKPSPAAPVALPTKQPPSPPQQAPVPAVVCTVTHRTFDKKNRKYGHVGIVQYRPPEKVKANGGKAYASWAYLTLDGVPTNRPERFESFDTEEEAVAHAKYAASRAP
jgi:hypothetical protein